MTAERALAPGIADPDDPDAWSELAAALHAEGRTEAAEAALRAGMAEFPDSAQLHFNLASLLLQSGRATDAEAAFSNVVALDPADQEAWLRLGLLRYQRADHFAAAHAFERAADIAGPSQGQAHRLAGFALADAGQPTGAAHQLTQALASLPADEEDLQLVSQLLFCRLELCDWGDAASLITRCRQMLDAGAVPVEPFTFLLLDQIGPRDQLALSQRFCAALIPTVALPARAVPDALQRRLRIGYFGDIFHEHATARLVTGMIEQHDHARFEVHAFSYGPDDDGERRRRLVEACDAFHDLRVLDVAQTAAYIHQQEIDILIDLNGWTGNTRSAALAWRPATVQVNWLGYPATMGDRRIADYLIGDPVVTPAAEADCYAETLALMPHAYQPNDRTRTMGSVPDRAAAGLPKDGFVFCCFNRPLKISPAVFELWCDILNEVPGSVLWLLEGSAESRANLAHRALARGIDPQRLIFAPQLGQEAHLARLSLADLVLDTWPYGAHTTASDALWCGVPVLTRVGQTFSSRVAASLLKACGLDELVTHEPADYLANAVRLALAPEALATLRRCLAENRLQSPLFDTVGFARDFEQLLQLIWRDHQAGGRTRVLTLAAD